MEKDDQIIDMPDNEGINIPPESNIAIDYKNSEYILRVLEIIEQKFSIIVSLISVIGYIIISAFGKMNSVKKYFGYLLFLIISFGFYKLGKLKITMTNWILVVIIICLLFYIGYTLNIFKCLMPLISF